MISSFSATMNGARYVVFPNRIRKKISPSNRRGLPLASPRVGSTASFVRNVSHQSVSVSRLTMFIPEPVSNTALNRSISRSSSPIEQENTQCVAVSRYTTEFLNVGCS